MVNLDAVQKARILNALNIAHLKVKSLYDAEDREGFFFRLWVSINGGPYFEILATVIGNLDYEFYTKVKLISDDKGDRLIRNADHVSAWQSRVYDEKKYGGAIKFNTLYPYFDGIMSDSDTTSVIMSVSGLPEHGDEFCNLHVADEMQFINPSDIRKIARISENEIALDYFL